MRVRVGVRVGVRVRVSVALRLHVARAHARVALVREEGHEANVRARATRTARGNVAVIARDEEYLVRVRGWG